MAQTSHSASPREQTQKGAGKEQAPFNDHIALLNFFLGHRAAIVAKMEPLLNAQKTPVPYQQDLALLSRLLKDCFFSLPDLSREQSRLRDTLEEAHWASGFKPRMNPGNDLVNPAEMLVRGFHFWRETRWPGHKGRMRYAQTLFNLYLIRCLALLCMRLWDTAADSAGTRLAQAQAVLDELWSSSPADQPVLVRDVRWLYPLAMSPTTDDLRGYFEVAEHIASTFSAEDQLETCKAAVQTGGGHLRAQLRHLAVQWDVPLHETSLVLLTRKSNALDVALLTQGLVPLLEAYEGAVQNSDDQKRLELAWAIYQGVSPDPELFFNRLELLGPYTMIEHLFITVDADGKAVYTDMGKRHLQLLQQYGALIKRLLRPLYEDCQHCRSQAASYSPYGVLYGFSSNLIELMAFKTLQRDDPTLYSLEDVFSTGGDDKLTWVSGWRKLPHVKAEVIRQYEYPRQFVEDISLRIEQTLAAGMTTAEAGTGAPLGRLYLLPENEAPPASLAQIPELQPQYILSSDPHISSAHKATALEEKQLLHCRLEGEFLLSYQTAAGWSALSKDLLTDVSGRGQDVKIAGLPRPAAEVLKLMCPDLVVLVHA